MPTPLSLPLTHICFYFYFHSVNSPAETNPNTNSTADLPFFSFCFFFLPKATSCIKAVGNHLGIQWHSYSPSAAAPKRSSPRKRKEKHCFAIVQFLGFHRVSSRSGLFGSSATCLGCNARRIVFTACSLTASKTGHRNAVCTLEISGQKLLHFIEALLLPLFCIISFAALTGLRSLYCRSGLS